MLNSAVHARTQASDAEVQLRCEAVRALGAMSGGGGVPHVEAVLAALAAGAAFAVSLAPV
jgi:hypothetical protein